MTNELSVGNSRPRTGEEQSTMDKIRSMYVKLQNLRRGQTMTEYALILAAIAVVVFITYQAMGNSINTMVNKVNSSLTSS
jgi:Flp pilus assembly pilin Flp